MLVSMGRCAPEQNDRRQDSKGFVGVTNQLDV